MDLKIPDPSPPLLVHLSNLRLGELRRRGFLWQERCKESSLCSIRIGNSRLAASVLKYSGTSSTKTSPQAWHWRGEWRSWAWRVLTSNNRSFLPLPLDLPKVLKVWGTEPCFSLTGLWLENLHPYSRILVAFVFFSYVWLEEKGKLGGHPIVLAETRTNNLVFALSHKKITEAKTENSEVVGFLWGSKVLKVLKAYRGRMGNGTGKSKEYYCLLSPNLECDLVNWHCSAFGKYHILNTKHSCKCTRLQ